MKITRPILSFGKKQTGGRNTQGLITVARSSLVKQRYRFIETKRAIFPGIGATILTVQADPNRSAHIAIILYPNAVVAYILHAQLASDQIKIYNLQEPPLLHEKGWSNFLRFLPLGSVIHNIELVPGRGGKLVRAAGTSAIILKKHKDTTLIKLKSGAQRYFHSNCVATHGTLSNQQHFLTERKKAGTTRLLGFRPHVRACSMNPVDHPLGGRTRGGAQPQNKNGLKNFTATAKKRKYSHLELVL